jgi:hypothetical protein
MALRDRLPEPLETSGSGAEVRRPIAPVGVRFPGDGAVPPPVVVEVVRASFLRRSRAMAPASAVGVRAATARAASRADAASSRCHRCGDRAVTPVTARGATGNADLPHVDPDGERDESIASRQRDGRFLIAAARKHELATDDAERGLALVDR